MVEFAQLDRDMGAPLKTAFLHTFSTHEAGEPSWRRVPELRITIGEIILNVETWVC